MSPPDRLRTLATKCKKYHAWGVPHCWIIDPETRSLWESRPIGLLAATLLRAAVSVSTPADDKPRKMQQELTAGPITLTIAEIFHGV